MLFPLPWKKQCRVAEEYHTDKRHSSSPNNRQPADYFFGALFDSRNRMHSAKGLNHSRLWSQ
jgi:hypothetical protein